MPAAEALRLGLPTSGRFIDGYRNGRMGPSPVIRSITSKDCACCGEPFLSEPYSRRTICNPCRQARLRAKWAERKRAYRAALAPDPTTVCSHCGASFERRRSTARFCSTACRVAAHRRTRASGQA